MAFDPAKLTRLSGPLSFIFPQHNQAKYWAYRTADDGVEDITADGFFPATEGIGESDMIWVFLSNGATPARYTMILLSVHE